MAWLVDQVLEKKPAPTIICRHDGDHVERNWHNIHTPDTSRLQPGSVCPVHGHVCRVVKSRGGLNRYKRTLNCRFEMPGWKLYSFHVQADGSDQSQPEHAMVLTPDRRLALAFGRDFVWTTGVDIPTQEGLRDWAKAILENKWALIPNKEHIVYAIPESTKLLLDDIAHRDRRGALGDSELFRRIREELLILVGGLRREA